MNSSRRLDVHHHFVPDFWADALPSHGGDPSGWKTPSWDIADDIAFMDELGIATSILSLTAPGVVGWRGQGARDMARRINDHAAEAEVRYPGRFGSFATLPMQDAEGALAEIAYSLDVLKADGVVLLSNYDGVYLSDVRFEPVWEELDRRGALVFVHPTMPKMDLLPGLPGPMIDYPFDTTRTAVSMIATGMMSRYTRLKVILSHAGGYLPFAAYRYAGSIAQFSQGARSIDSVIDEMKRFYFDTALSASATALPCLLEFARPGHVLFGSDTPYAAKPRVAGFTRYLDEYTGFAPGQLQAINRESALPLLPRFHSST